jgi:hypothetical protein
MASLSLVSIGLLQFVVYFTILGLIDHVFPRNTLGMYENI